MPLRALALALLLPFAILVPTPVAASGIHPMAVASYLGFHADLLAVDEQTLNASLAVDLQANVENSRAPEHLEMQLQQGETVYPPIPVPRVGNNSQYTNYQYHEVLKIPLPLLNATLFPYDNYMLDVMIRIVPSMLFVSNTTVEVAQLSISPTLGNAPWVFDRVGQATYHVDSRDVLWITGISARVARNSYAVQQVLVPIYGIFLIVGGTMMLEITRYRRRENATNRLTVFVAAFVGLTGFSLTNVAKLPSGFPLPTLAGLLLTSAEVAAAILTFATLLGGCIVSGRRVLLIDTVAVIIVILLIPFWIVRVSFNGVFIYDFLDLPLLSQIAILGAFSSGIIVRYILRAFHSFAG